LEGLGVRVAGVSVRLRRVSNTTLLDWLVVRRISIEKVKVALVRRSTNESVGRGCVHLHSVTGRPPSGQGCARCLESGYEWVHLSICMACGHVGCCDCSPHRHAMGHWLANRDHPLVRSYEDGEDWWWCYPEELRFEVKGAPPSPSHG
jgi:hypothetical protein